MPVTIWLERKTQVLQLQLCWRTRQPGPDIMKYAFNHQQWQPTSLGNGLPFGHELNLRINKAKNYSVQDYLIHLKCHFVIADSNLLHSKANNSFV